MRRAWAAIPWLFAAWVGATERHVTTGGSGSACTAGSPCSLTYATRQAVWNPGDIIWIHGGTYTPSGANSFVVWESQGTPASPIIFRNYQNEEVVIDCNAVVSDNCIGIHGTTSSQKGENIWFWGLKVINSSTGTRFKEHGHVSVSTSSTTVTRVDGSMDFIASPSAVVHVISGSPTVAWVSGTVFTTGSSWNGDRIELGGVAYTVASVQSTTSLTLTANYASGTSDVAGVLPSLWSGGTMVIDTAGTPTNRVISHCTSVSSCVMTSAWTAAGGTKEAHFPPSGNPGIPNTPGLSVTNNGSKFINMFFFDRDGGTNVSGSYGGNLTLYGSFDQYAGVVGTDRSYGHGGYYQNLEPPGEAGRSWIIDNVILRPFYLGMQMYATGTDVSYMTFQGNVVGANGHAAYPTSAWPATGCCASGGGLYLGTSGAGSSGCPPSQGGTGSTKTLTGVIIDNNWLYGPTQTPFNLGGSKGSCNTTITNNRFINGVSPGATTNSTFPPLVITGNTFMTTLNGGGGPAPLMTQANYPSNTFLPSVPTSGADVFKYEPNDYESGRGFVAVDNQDSSPTTTIDPAQMGCYAGEQIRIFNWQDNDPWDSTPIATQTGCAPLVVSTTLAAGSIRQPGFTDKDGVTPFPKPPDLGPRFVVYFMYPDWGLATTPTPTNTTTSTPTHTFTPTASLTPTPGAPSPTPTSTFTGLPTSTATFTPSNTPTTTPTPSSLSASFEAESCGITAPMVAVADAAAAGGFYVASPTQYQGMITCTFSVPVTGPHRIWALTYGADGTHDSFFVDLDGDGEPTCDTAADSTCPHVFDIAEQIQPCEDQAGQFCNKTSNWGEWWWNPLNDRVEPSCGLCIAENYVERRPVLTAGSHTLKFRQRDPGSRLDYIIVTSDMNYVPSGTPGAPTPTPTPGGRKHRHTCNHKTAYHTHPYVLPNTHYPCPWK